MDKTVERIIKVPRVRIIDCSRLIFRLSKIPEWRDIDLDPDLFPVYPLPPLQKNSYYLYGNRIDITFGSTINDIVRKICKLLNVDDRIYLHTIIFRKTGELEIQTETI